MNNQAFSKIFILIILVVFIIGGFIAWQYFGGSKEVVKDETANWKTYHSEIYTIKYPDFLEEKLINGIRLEEIYFPVFSIVPDYFVECPTLGVG